MINSSKKMYDFHNATKTMSNEDIMINQIKVVDYQIYLGHWET